MLLPGSKSDFYRSCVLGRTHMDRFLERSGKIVNAAEAELPRNFRHVVSILADHDFRPFDASHRHVFHHRTPGSCFFAQQSDQESPRC
jgi:hypothetical protein